MARRIHPQPRPAQPPGRLTTGAGRPPKVPKLEPESDEGRRYLDEIATALADTPTAAPLAPQLAAASAIASDQNPDLIALANALDALADELSALTGARCL